MKLLTLFQIAFKYLFRYRRRYFFLFLALVFGFGVITAITSLKEGMVEMLYRTAQAHYAGDIIVLGYDNASIGQTLHLRKSDADAVFEAVQGTSLRPDRVVVRSNFMNNASLYSNGRVVHLKYVTGVDWNDESAYFNGINWTSKPERLGEDSILISSPIAEQLGTKQGDNLILEVYDYWGQRNTGSFTIAGIIADKSIFGYFKSYIAKDALNRLVGFDNEDCSMVGLFFQDRRNIAQKQALLQAALEQRIDMGPLLHNRDDFAAETAAPFTGLRAFVLTLEVYLSELSDLLNAMNILSYLLFLMMLIIIFVSAFVTYRLILYERTKELGTMRVIGFQEEDIAWVLVMEAACLAVVSVIVGFFFSFLLVKLFSFLPFTQIPSFEIFMKNGELFALFNPRTVLFNAFAVFCMLLPALGLPVHLMAKETPAQMLRSE
ncbi:MAG: ABC transporter permease [Treponema sp.]|jgi:ABC-type lipoprotein release transport system permease subunit|nr:ABC transporter permease [Treponema sp.]